MFVCKANVSQITLPSKRVNCTQNAHIGDSPLCSQVQSHIAPRSALLNVKSLQNAWSRAAPQFTTASVLRWPTTVSGSQSQRVQSAHHTFPHTSLTYFSTSAHSHSGFSSAAKCPPLSCCSYVAMFPPFSNTCLMPGNSSYGKKLKPTGLEM
jgi:hypothetical protein